MNARIWKLAAVVCLLATAAGCKTDTGKTPSAPGPSIAITPSATSVVSNGTNTVSFSFTDTGGVAVTVTTDRGSFPGNVQSVVIPAGTGGTTGTLVLTTCNSGTNVGCAGVANVRASSTTGTASASVNFTALSAACQTNCGADAQCPGQSCTLTAGGTGSCSAGPASACTSAPACTKNPANATTETSCSDGIDNDCNGQIDCADTACDGQACGTNATSRCVSSQCTDLASGLAITVTSDRQRLPANGSTTANITVTLTSNSKPASNMSVTVTTTAGLFGTATTATTTTGRDGTARFQLTAPSAPGTVVITAVPDILPGTLSASTSIVVPRLGSIQIPKEYAVHPVMGVKTSGWNEQNWASVQVLDDQGQAYPDGLEVTFEQRVLGGSSFAAPTVACTATPNPCSGYKAPVSGGGAADQVDKTGLATAPLYSGTVAGTIAITATTAAAGVTASATLPAIAVVGAKANLANFSIQCSPRNVPALAETDCSTSWVDAPITCVASLKDRFNNLLGTSTQVQFASEAPAVGQPVWTTAYDPATQGSAQQDLGTATQILQTLMAGLPFDVDPQPGEPSWDPTADRCKVVHRNPRDGVVTIIAIADGEEAFFDANGNGQYDPGEPFVDQGEPFVDQNDNGKWDPGEWFLDVNGDGNYDGPNGQWDAQTKIWTQTAIVYTGGPAVITTPTGLLGNRWVNAASFVDACTPTPAATGFTVKPSTTGPPPTAGGVAPYYVVASDENLNFLDPGTSYKVTVPTGTVTATYYGLPQYADELGFFYRYWPCDTLNNCASQCRATVGIGGTGPCTMKPSVSSFTCGVHAGVNVIGSSAADAGDEVDWTVQTPWNVLLGQTSLIDIQRLTGKCQ